MKNGTRTKKSIQNDQRIVEMVGMGMDNQAIGTLLHLTPGTVAHIITRLRKEGRISKEWRKKPKPPKKKPNVYLHPKAQKVDLSDKDIGLRKITCPVCGKEFYYSGQWAYRIPKQRKVCSWGCVRQWERKQHLDSVMSITVTD